MYAPTAEMYSHKRETVKHDSLKCMAVKFITIAIKTGYLNVNIDF